MAKIHINLQQGIIDIEGEEQFVREMLTEVRSSVAAGAVMLPALGNPVVEELGAAPEEKSKAKAPGKAKAKVSSAEAGKVGIPKYYKGKFNPALDLLGLEEFCATYKPQSSKERSLVYAAFFRDKLGISPCSADDLYTCYWATKSEASIPEAFGKSLNDARRDGYITYSNIADIEIPTAGENALTKLAKKAAG